MTTATVNETAVVVEETVESFGLTLQEIAQEIYNGIDLTTKSDFMDAKSGGLGWALALVEQHDFYAHQGEYTMTEEESRQIAKMVWEMTEGEIGKWEALMMKIKGAKPRSLSEGVFYMHCPRSGRREVGVHGFTFDSAGKISRVK